MREECESLGRECAMREGVGGCESLGRECGHVLECLQLLRMRERGREGERGRGRGRGRVCVRWGGEEVRLRLQILQHGSPPSARGVLASTCALGRVRDHTNTNTGGVI